MQVLDALAARPHSKSAAAGCCSTDCSRPPATCAALTAAPELWWCQPTSPAPSEPRPRTIPASRKSSTLPKELDLANAAGGAVPCRGGDGGQGRACRPYRSKPFRWEEIGPEDVELEDIFRTQGPDAYQRREKEFTRQAMNEVQEHKRAIQRARYVVEAARRNEERLLGTPEERARNAAEIKRELAEVAAKRRAELEAAVAAAATQPQEATELSPTMWDETA